MLPESYLTWSSRPRCARASTGGGGSCSGSRREGSARRRAVEMFLDLGYEVWACEKSYGMRWMVETAYSTFKRLFGECSLSRSLENIAYELVAKASLYNLLANM